MNEDNLNFRKRKSMRRLALLASVAGVAGVLMLAAPNANHQFNLPAFSRAAQAAETAPHMTGFADVVAKVKPAVISVRVKIDQAENSATTDHDQNAMPFEPGTPFDKFFHEFGMPDMRNAMPQRRRMITGLGSGFFISPDGYAVTNYHVVDHAKSVQVTMDDGKSYTAKVIGTDQKTDLALIKVDGGDFPYVKFADGNSRVGDWVIAVGNPFGLGGTVTAGIVSARGRDIGAGPYDDYIQIDAPINKGNSGGPAFDTDGKVIGVNTAIYSPSGGSVGIGFDIPAETAKMVVAQLKDKGYVTRGWIGVQIQPVTTGIASSLGLKEAQGALVDEPQAGSPAAKAGIEAGDVITAVDGAKVKGSRDLARRIAMTAPGTAVKLDLLHKGQMKTVTIALAQMPNEQASAANHGPNQQDNAPNLGLMLAPAKDVAGSGNNGVVVLSVDPNGTAAEHGLQAGDVILSIAGKTVANVSDVRSALVKAKTGGKHDILMRIKRADSTSFVALPLQDSGA